MLNIDLKSRFKNKAFIVSLVSAIVLLIQQLGFRNLIPSNYSDIVNTLLTIGTMLGIIVDTSTPGISDKVISDVTVQAINDEVLENSQIRSTDEFMGLNDKGAETHASIQNLSTVQVSSKIAVDNPDNTQQVGATVNATSAATPL